MDPASVIVGSEEQDPPYDQRPKHRDESPRSLIAKRRNRIERRRLARSVEPEEHTDGSRKAERHQHGFTRDDSGPSHDLTHGQRRREAERHTNRASRKTQYHRFD